MTKEEKVNNFISKLINHIDEKCAEAASLDDCDSSMRGMAGWKTEDELRKSIRMIFGTTPKNGEDYD